MSQVSPPSFISFPSGAPSAGAPDIGNGVFADPPGQPTEFYKIRTRYLWLNGTAQLPIAMQNADLSPVAASIIQLHSPCGVKIVTWATRKLGDIPTLPDWEPDNDNQTLSTADIEFDDVEFTANQTPIVTVRGQYIYLLTKPISIERGVFHLGGAPCYTLDAGQSTVTAENFSSAILSTGDGENPG
jgi:hypothetical protein